MKDPTPENQFEPLLLGATLGLEITRRASQPGFAVPRDGERDLCCVMDMDWVITPLAKNWMGIMTQTA